jgi:arginase family enzyme
LTDPLVVPTVWAIDQFWGTPHVPPADVPTGRVAVIGVPHDMTLSTRSGTRHAPKAIRQHSCHLIALDPSGIMSRLAAAAIFTFLAPCLFQEI